MMQEDSNGESSFEFVPQKSVELTPRSAGTGEILAPAVPAAAAGVNLLSSVPPPSALPSFVIPSPPPPIVGEQQVKAAELASQSPTHVSSQPMQNSPMTTFSPAIPHNEADTSCSGCSGHEACHEEQAGAGASLLGWVKGAVGSGGLLSRVAEKAKNSVDTMITTLDPQMREFIYSGGDIDIVVASEKEVKISPVREAFQAVFGRATVTGQEAQPKMVAAQPVGFAAGCQAAEERVVALRQTGNIPEQIPVVAVESFLLEISDGKWFDLAVLVLDDPTRKVSLQTFTQLTPVPERVVERAQVDTPSDYPLRWSGLAVPIGKLMAEHLQVSPGAWHEALTGVTRRDMLLLSAKTLAGLYKNTLSG